MFKNIDKAFRKHSVLTECIVGTAAVVYLIYTMRAMLIFGQATLVHDNLLWNYPIFRFFAENIINGHFPFWNPFEHGGEPFYPLLVQIRLLEPVTLLIIYIGRFISNDILMLFNWNRFILSLIMVSGIYIVLRSFAKYLFIRLTLIPILLYSSIMLGSFRQDAILNQFIWIPFIAFFLLRIIYYRDCRWYNWIMLGIFIGLNWQSYFFSGTWVFLLLFFSGIILFRRDLLIKLFNERIVIAKFAVAALIIIAMAAPNIILFLEKDKYVFPARMIDYSYEGMAPGAMPQQYEVSSSSVIVDGINMPYNFITFTGAFSNIWDFIQIIAPDGNKSIRWPGREGWGWASEAYMYIGLLPWAIALLGLIAGRHDLKRVWLLILVCFALIMLGPPGGLHRLLYYLYPPMLFVRHTHAFVLFFMFALLYFYVLGLNHIFSTWGGYLFNQNSPQGVLNGFIRDSRVRNGIAVFIFSFCIIFSVYWMTKITYPATDYLFVFFIIVFAIGWILRRDLGENGLYISLIASHIIIVLLFSANTFKFIRYIFPALGIPIIFFILVRLRGNPLRRLMDYLPLILLLIFSAVLTIDLLYSLRKSSFLYKDKTYSTYILNSERMPHRSVLPQNRAIYPPGIEGGSSESEQRYLSLIYWKPYVLSPINDPDYSGHHVLVKGIFVGLKNMSFENWVAAKEGNYLPEEFSYHQDGSGGVVERYTGYDGVKDGSAAVLLKPSSAGDSYIRFQTSQIEEIRGKHIRLSIWVKSQNKSRDAIQVEIQDYVRRVADGIQADAMEEIKKGTASKFYKNSGEWERLSVGKYIDKNATKIAISCNIKPIATMPVFLDNLLIEIVDVNTNAFEYALKSKRWSSFLLPMKYFELINKDIQPAILEEMFAVNKPMFQFKKDVVSVKDSDVSALFRYLGTEKSIKLLHEAVIVDSQTEPSLAKPILAYADIGKMMQAFIVPENFKGIENIFDKKDKGSFTYSIERYDYNSFTMKAAADSPGILYWADGYDKGWHAYINGKEVPIYRANINFKAINIPAGRSNINFTYTPFSFKMGLYIFYGIVIISIVPLIIGLSTAFLYNFLQNGLSLKIRKI
ncbi:MAG: YfhO family protein [Nitrospirae bacterium]|nr:YfhO family protein [Nitrospirota bacterium]